MLASLVAAIVFAVGALYLQRNAGVDQAIRLSSQSTRLMTQIVRPHLTRTLLAGDPTAIAQLDAVVRGSVLDDDLVRVKVWRGDGTIVYSDRRDLVGQRFHLDDEEMAALRSGEIEGELSDLGQPENRFERRYGKLLEMYQGTPTASGEPVLVEGYQRFSGVAAGGRGLWLAFAPTLLGAIALLWLTQGPIAFSMARRLRSTQRDRERLLEHAVDTSEYERRRIAADLHDGVVQRLAGTAFALAATSAKCETAPRHEMRSALDASTGSVRHAMQELRSLIVEIHPPNLEVDGLECALRDLIVPADAQGVDVRVEVDEGGGLEPATKRLMFRGAQEGLRNVLEHAGAVHAEIRVRRRDGVVILTVDDDGGGVDAARRAERRGDGHVGLELLAALVGQCGGRLELGCGPLGGARLTVEVPAR